MGAPDQIPKISGSLKTTLTSMVYPRLLDDIVSGKLKPGTKLRLQELRKRYNVGSTPLREALNRLSANGMVVCDENRGFRVSPVDTGELLELIKTRCWLEEIALRESMKNGDKAWEERIVVIFHWLSKTTRTSMKYSSVWEDYHRQFHLALLKACDSKFLMDCCGHLMDLTLRYRNLAPVLKYRESHEMDEHQAIKEAVLDRDEGKAVELLVAHYQVTADIIINSGILNSSSVESL